MEKVDNDYNIQYSPQNNKHLIISVNKNLLEYEISAASDNGEFTPKIETQFQKE